MKLLLQMIPFFLTSNLMLGGFSQIQKLERKSEGLFQVKCENGHEETATDNSVRSGEVCSGPADWGNPFELRQSASLNEGAYCTAKGWEKTNSSALARLKYKAKENCLSGSPSYPALQEVIPTVCEQDCTEASGTVSKCRGYFRCSMK